MILTVYYDGQFWVGVIEIQESGSLKVYRYVFGTEPRDTEVLEFVNHQLPDVIEKNKQVGIEDKKRLNIKVNPKRLQRQVAKEIKQKGISTKSQEAIKENLEQHKKESKECRKQNRDAFKRRKREIKKQKAKQKHRGR